MDAVTTAAFQDSLADAAPPKRLTPALLALWHAARGEWDASHGIVQQHEGEAGCDWVHALLHRIEGDAANAAYWYRRAGRPVATGSIEAERDAMLSALIGA